MSLLYCPSCHKVFYYELPCQDHRWCPNCSDGRYYHGKSEEDYYSDDILLKRVSPEVLKEILA